MKEKLTDALVNLLKVKSLISIAAIIVFQVLSLKGVFDTAYIKEILMLVFVFYFGTQSGKQTAREEAEQKVYTLLQAPATAVDENEDPEYVSTSAIGFDLADDEPDFTENEPEEEEK